MTVSISRAVVDNCARDFWTCCKAMFVGGRLQVSKTSVVYANVVSRSLLVDFAHAAMAVESDLLKFTGFAAFCLFKISDDE